MKRAALVVLSLLSALGSAATLTVTSPARGSAGSPTLVGLSTQIQMRLTGMRAKAEVTAQVIRLSDSAVIQSLDTEIDPDADFNGTGSLALAFAPGTSEEVYRVEVRARDLNNETTYNADQDLYVKPDLTNPKFLSYSPLNASFVKGTVTLKARIEESNLKTWRVLVDGLDIPNNTGSTLDSNGEFSVQWSTDAYDVDGSHTIQFRVKDQANNEVTRNVTVILDRVAPSVTIVSPRSGTVFAPGTTILVTVDVRDGANVLSVNASGVDVVVRTTAGTFLTRVARSNFRIGDDGTLRWTGRIRWRDGFLPPTFLIGVSVIDKAGNASALQSVTCSIGG